MNAQDSQLKDDNVDPRSLLSKQSGVANGVQKYLIVSLNIVDLLSILGLFCNVYAIMLIANGLFDAALALLFVGMAIDFADGPLARSLNTCRDFGRYLDGSIDIFLYLLAPTLFLYLSGMDAWYHVVALFAFNASGVVRLSVFNEVGNIASTSGKSAYFGMPVYWSVFSLGVYETISWFVAAPILNAFMTAWLFIFAFLMLYRATFSKIQNWRLAISIMLALAVSFLFAHNSAHCGGFVCLQP